MQRKRVRKISKWNVQHQLFVYLMHTGVMDPPRSSDSLWILSISCLFLLHYFHTQPIFPLINSMSSIACDNPRPNTLNSWNFPRFLEIIETKKSLCTQWNCFPFLLGVFDVNVSLFAWANRFSHWIYSSAQRHNDYSILFECCHRFDPLWYSIPFENSTFS